MTKVFSHCELDHFPDGCGGCSGDGKGDCAAVFVEVLPKGPAVWTWQINWTRWVFGPAWQGGIIAFHIGPLLIMRAWA